MTSAFMRRRDLKGWLAKTVWRACGCWVGALGAVWLCSGATWGQAPAPPAAAKVRFESDIEPLLKARCQKCHAGENAQGGLRLVRRSDLLKGGESGPAIRLAAAESSLLWEKLASNEMPREGGPLTAAEKGLLRQWINDGAPGDEPDPAPGEVGGAAGTGKGSLEHWSFHAPTRPAIPAVQQAGLVRSPIDAFVLAALELQGLTLAGEANRAVLARRLAFDLTGLPPDPELVRSFLEDGRPEAVEQLVETLLAHPGYGERWGRHWLDLAGYADSAGVLAEDRPIPNMYRYRDYVVRAFNSNKPYDRFLQEQLAGDELSDYHTAFAREPQLPDDVVEAVTATGFLRCAPDSSRPDFSTIKNADAQYFYPTLNDTLQIVSSATLGLTVQCARCHSHKYDPIPQAEFYRLQAIFMPALRPKQWIPQMERKILVATASQQQAAAEHNGRLDAEIAKSKQRQAELQKEFGERLFGERLAKLPEVLRDDVKQALGREPEKRSEVDKYLVSKFGAELRPEAAQLPKVLSETYPEFKAGFDEQTAAMAAQERQRRHFDELRALYDLPGPVTTPVLRRGDPLVPGAPVEPGVPTALQTPRPFDWQAPPAEAPTSGRRLAFARWLTQPDHPLTARVFVNRVWLLHFGEGLVSTPEDFGSLGAAPSHPELLDWLAREFVDSGWDVKHLHRLIVLSSVYRQSSTASGETLARGQAVDPDNRLLWRQRIRRLEGESVRDALLAVAGRLEQRMYGPGIAVARQPDGEVTVADPNADRRRSIYYQVLRSNPLTLLQLFDTPVMETNCVRRGRSTVATQALTLLNSETLVRMAEGFALRTQSADAAAGVTRAVWLAYSRPPEPDELAELLAFLEGPPTGGATEGDAAKGVAGWVDLCHMLLAANEFVYVD